MGNCEIEGGEFLTSPLSARAFIDWRSEDALIAWKPAIYSDDGAKSEAITGEIEAAIDELISGGIVVSRSSPRSHSPPALPRDGYALVKSELAVFKPVV